jgi:hypothetical protein
MNVKEVIVTAPIAVESLSPMTYTITRAIYRAEGIKLPTADIIDLTFRSNLWCLARDVDVYVKTDDEWIEFKFKKGLIFDLASVPRFFRSIVDDNDQTVLHAALVHDICFTSHFLEFRDANRVFKAICLSQGASRVKAGIYYAGVNNIVGRALYSKETPKRDVWQNGFYECSRRPL